ncbi:hypothetical protein F5878DRAFT_633852 [Lentinula raphanica]|uniref:Uncharacterized protein n=1 Tax=Lentinula raphanica TaxID=153919 RepID=A0AA38U686_9AGAR|nr:hypothetical protein F5878DRAFT_633852 [Lentinula raphanica]
MKTLLLGNDNRDLGGNFLIHSRLHSDGGSDKNPTRQMRIDAAHAMVERIRTLDSFFEGLKAHDPVLRAKYEELQAKRAQDEDTNSRAEKEAIDREDQEGRHANKKQKANPKITFREAEDWRTGKPVWDEYVQALRSGKKYTLPPPPTPPT